jgi:hypothetical protein
MTYEEWEENAHERVRAEPIWQFLGYRKALFFYELVWQDCESLVRDRRGCARHLVSSEVLDQRLALADEVIASLVIELNRQRSR